LAAEQEKTHPPKLTMGFVFHQVGLGGFEPPICRRFLPALAGVTALLSRFFNNYRGS
jgi:hypothetical protein